MGSEGLLAALRPCPRPVPGRSMGHGPAPPARRVRPSGSTRTSGPAQQRRIQPTAQTSTRSCQPSLCHRGIEPLPHGVGARREATGGRADADLDGSAPRRLTLARSAWRSFRSTAQPSFHPFTDHFRFLLPTDLAVEDHDRRDPAGAQATCRLQRELDRLPASPRGGSRSRVRWPTADRRRP